MKFVFPIKGKTARELYQLNQNGFGGFYPIGVNNAYHGGIHFEGDHSVIAIADGTIVAYRYTRDYIPEQSRDQISRYSNCFVLIRHKYKTPKGQELVFYSHYIHLCPWDKLTPSQKRNPPAIIVKQGYEIIASGLNVRQGPSGDHPKVEGRILSKRDQVVASPANGNWAKIEGVEEYFCIKGSNATYAKPKAIISPPELDVLTTCEIPVEAGTLIGYTGLCEEDSAPRGYTVVHVEVFAGDDAEEFVKNPKGDGKRTQIIIPAGTRLKKKKNKYADPSTITRFKRESNTLVEIVDQNDGNGWVKVKDKKVAAKVAYAWLHDKYDPPKPYPVGYSHGTHKHYTVKLEHADHVRASFPGYKINGEEAGDQNTNLYNETSATKLFFKHKDGSIRTALLDAADSGKEYWIKRSLLTGAGELKSDTDKCYEDNPEAFDFEDGDNVPNESSVEKRRADEVRKDGKSWYGVKLPEDGIQGWVSEDDAEVANPYTFPRFKILKEREPSSTVQTLVDTTARDKNIDYNRLPQFFKDIFDEIDTEAGSSGEITRAELHAAMKKPEIANKLSRLICYHQSEWWVDERMSYWQDVLDTLRTPSADNLRRRIQESCWWGSVTFEGIPSHSVYHWNPVAFVEQMRLLGGDDLTREQFDQIFTNASSPDEYLEAINETMHRFEINNFLRKAHFLAQVAHETKRLLWVEELADGSGYEGSETLGNTHAGDGPRFKGRGLLQLTGRTNYTKFQSWVRANVEGFENLDITSSTQRAIQVATNVRLNSLASGWYWRYMRPKSNQKADADDVFWVSVYVNGWSVQAEYYYSEPRKTNSAGQALEPNHMKERAEELERVKGVLR